MSDIAADLGRKLLDLAKAGKLTAGQRATLGDWMKARLEEIGVPA
jgi:hypothetical protein